MAPLFKTRHYFRRPKQGWNSKRAVHFRPEGGQQKALPPPLKMAPAEGAEYLWVVMAASRLELNLVRLLCRCEAMAAERRDPDEWRLEKYVGALEDMLQALKAQASKPASEVINEYSRKVDFLKGMLQAEKLTSSSEKALANQFLAPGRVPTTAKERVPATKTLHLQSRARYTSEMRSELLGTDSTGEPELDVRKRTGVAGPRPGDEKQSAAELDLVLQRHQNLQEKLAEEMLGLARSLKTNTLAAQSVIKKDNQTLSHSLKMADQNLEKLKTESERLEQHTQKSVNWLLWAMLIIVCFIFISMILFIRIMPKLK
ncbi:vesicle transport protein USE1 [Camelus dromedarius]|uniref:Vesicle transport protein USE1 n=2 Tax=Camelus TaxID=9836 RepID=A0A8B6Y7E2_CAMFR|nr:vesicle transport protein USE1 isoform X1 [Camelus ferus]XP_010970413.1 vesicle transport protein USE1 isoform X1 [Camelus bactrianus]XP_010993378.1 vesicle transport protein USE1 isoform X1 [Camelus dromedarius]